MECFKNINTRLLSFINFIGKMEILGFFPYMFLKKLVRAV